MQHISQRERVKTIDWFIQQILFYNQVVQNKGPVSHSFYFTICHVTKTHQKRLYHAFWGSDVFGTLVRVIIGCKGSQDRQTIEHLQRCKPGE